MDAMDIKFVATNDWPGERRLSPLAFKLHFSSGSGAYRIIRRRVAVSQFATHCWVQPITGENLFECMVAGYRDRRAVAQPLVRITDLCADLDSLVTGGNKDQKPPDRDRCDPVFPGDTDAQS